LNQDQAIFVHKQLSLLIAIVKVQINLTSKRIILKKKNVERNDALLLLKRENFHVIIKVEISHCLFNWLSYTIVPLFGKTKRNEFRSFLAMKIHFTLFFHCC